MTKCNSAKDDVSGLTYTVTFGLDDKKELAPTRIIYNNRRTIVEWNDGTKTVATASKYEVFDVETGFAHALKKKLFGRRVYGEPLYKRFIHKAVAHDDDAKVALDTWKRTEKERIKEKREKLIDDDEFPF